MTPDPSPSFIKVWYDPFWTTQVRYSKALTEKMEAVQRRVPKLVTGMNDLQYSQRRRKIGLPAMRYRMLGADMIEVYKMVHDYYEESACIIIKLRGDTMQQKMSV